MSAKDVAFRKVQAAYGEVVAWVAVDPSVKTATKYMDPKYVIKATRHGKPDRRYGQVHMVVTLGKPNCREKEFIKACLKAGEPFPVKKCLLKRVK